MSVALEVVPAPGEQATDVQAPGVRASGTETAGVSAAGGPVTVGTAVAPAAWDAYVSSHERCTVDHLWAWRGVFESVFGHDCQYLAAWRAGALVGVLPLVRFRSRLFGRFLVSVPHLNYGGLLADDDEAARALIGAARASAQAFGASHVELRHEARQAPDLPFRQHKVAMRLPLPASSDALWTGIDRKIRNQVRKAQKEGLEAVDGGAELLGEFYRVFATNMRDLGTPVYSRRLFEATLQQFGAAARVHLVRHRGVAVAGSVTVSGAETMVVPWASALREYRHLCPNVLLYWSMLERAIASGARTFDFGRSSRDAGTHHFKQQWGAQETALHWEYVLLTRAEAPDHGPTSSKFNLAISAWQRLPMWVANRIGPSIVRNIP